MLSSEFCSRDLPATALWWPRRLRSAAKTWNLEEHMDTVFFFSPETIQFLFRLDGEIVGGCQEATQAVATHLSHCWGKAGFHRPSASSSTEGYSQRKVRCYKSSPQAASGFSSENCCVLYSRTSHCNQTAVRGWKDGFLRL